MEVIINKVKSLKEIYETSCPFKLAKFLGIHVVFENLGGTFGYYNKHFRIKIIHINQNVDEKKQRFICAHELGHAIFHPDANTPFLKKHTLFSTNRIEVEANLFATQLLFSEFSDRVYLKEVIDNFGVPKDFITFYLDLKNF